MRFVLLVLFLGLATGGDVPFSGSPWGVPDLLNFFGSELGAARLTVDFDTTEDFLTLRSSFICPAQNASADCSSPAAQPSCSCDFTQRCSELHACCATDPGTSAVYQLACGDYAGDAFHVFTTTDNRKTVVVGTSATYFRYHPSETSRCKGFGLTVRAPHQNVTGEDVVNVAMHSYELYVSFTNPRPEEDPDAQSFVFHSINDPFSAIRSTFCLYTSDPIDRYVVPSSRWIPSTTNAASVFFSVFSATSATTLGVIDVSATVSLFESSDISQQALITVADPLAQVAIPQIYPGQTYTGTMPGSATYFLFYEHDVAADCANVGFDLRIGGSADCDVSIAGSTSADRSFTGLLMWSSYQYGNDQITVNLCPGEAFTLLLQMYFTTDVFYLTVVVDPVVELLSLSADLHPFLIAPNIIASSQLVCGESYATPFFYTDTEKYFYCSQWQGWSPNDCREYLLLPPLQDATTIWPPGSRNFLSSDVLQSLNTQQVSDTLDLTYVPGTFRAAAVVNHRHPTTAGNVVSEAYFEWSMLETCHLLFLDTIVTPSGDRLSGPTDKIAPIIERVQCNPESTTQAMRQINQLSELFSTSSFLNNLTFTEQQTLLLHQVLLALNSDVSPCSWLLSEVYLDTTEFFVGDVLPSANCSLDDPCCPTAPSSVRSFYGYCPASVDWLLASETTVNTSILRSSCDEGACTAALLEEMAEGMFRLQPGSNAQDSSECSLQQDATTLLLVQLAGYYSACKVKYIGMLDAGIPCQQDSDCPIGTCQHVDSSKFDRYFYRSTKRRLFKVCIGNTLDIGNAIFDCLISKNLPVILQYRLFGSMVSEITAAQRKETWQKFSRPGCTSETSLDMLGDRRPLITHYGPLSDLYSSCPQPISCLDDYCVLPAVCTSPWQNSPHGFGAYQQSVLDQAQCEAQLKCNVAPPYSDFHFCAATDAPQGTTECQAEIGGSASFCGYCPSGSADDGGCFLLVDAENRTQTCTASESIDSCYFSDLNLLLNEPCNGRGSCTIASASGDLLTITTESECRGHQGMCLSAADRSLTFEGNGCIGGIQVQDAYFACPQIVRATNIGCLYSDVNDVPYPGYSNREECEGQLDPYFPPSFDQHLRWIDTITTRAQCLEDERMFVCTLPANSSIDYPVLNNKTVCALRGGVFASTFVWEDPVFIAGVSVQATAHPVQAIPAYTWVPEGIFDFIAFSSFVTTSSDSVQMSTDVTTAICAYSTTQSVALSAASCGCYSADNSSDNQRGCKRFSKPNAQALPPAQLLGTTRVCNSAQFSDGLTYPSTIYLPPLELAVLPDAHLPGGCYSATLSLYSNSRMITRRERIRETSFFVARQDVDFPPLCTYSSLLSGNGRVLSDGVLISGDTDETFENVQVCIRPRQDFLSYLQEHLDNTTRFKYLDFGVVNGWVVNPLERAPANITVMYMSADGSFYEAATQNSEVLHPLTEVVEVCRAFNQLAVGPSSSILTLVLVGEDPQQTENGYDIAQTVWLYITASLYLLPMVAVFLPLLGYSFYTKDFNLTISSGIFLSLFLAFRAALLYCLAAPAFAQSSVTEFALTDIAVLCEFSALSLLALNIFGVVHSSKSLRIWSPSKSIGAKAIVILLATTMLVLYIAFVITYGVVDTSASGVSSPRTTCVGRIAAGTEFWTTQRIVRFIYELLLVVFCLGLGLVLAVVTWYVSQHKANYLFFRLTLCTSILSFAMVSHGVIAVILLSTGYNDFIFGLTMLYVTELIPVVVVWFIVSKDRITSAGEYFFGSTGRSTSGFSPSGSGRRISSHSSHRTTPKS